MRLAFKILLFVVTFLIAFAISLGIAGYFLRDKLVDSTLTFLNNRIDAELKVEEVQFSMLSGFPNVSVNLKGVEIFEGSLNTPADLEPGLLSINEVSVRIGLSGILRNQYQFKKIILRDGWINLYYNALGKGNFEIFSKQGEQSASWLFNLDELQLERINLSYIDLRTGWIFKGLVNRAGLNGQISAKQTTLGIAADASVGVLRQGSFYYIRNQHLSLNTNFVINDDLVEVLPSIGSLGASRLSVSGSIGRQKGAPVWVSVGGDNFDVNHLLSFLSQHNISLPAGAKTKGNIAFSLAVDGYTKMENPYMISLDFRSNGLAVDMPGKPKLEFKTILGTFTNGDQGKPESSEVNISQIDFASGVSRISGSLRLKNLNSPLYHLEIDNLINIPDLKSWGVQLPADAGLISGNFEVLGRLPDFSNITLQSFEKSKFYASLNLSNVDFEQAGIIPDLKRVGGTLNINNQDISNAKLYGLFYGSRFDAEFKATNASALLFKNQKTTVNASITLDSLNTQWLDLTRSEIVENDDKTQNSWDQVESLSGDLFIDKFVHNKFSATPFSASFYSQGNNFYCNSFLARSCNGLLTGKFSIAPEGTNTSVFSADIDADNIDMQQLFTAFEDFGQDVITSKNISGDFSGSLVVSAPMVERALELNEMEAKATVKLQNGRLINVKQLESLSRFIELDELMDIRFSTLENAFRITDGVIVIPEMDIQSSALDLNVSGTHTFAGDYRYRAQLYLSDVLFSKQMQQKINSDPFGEVDDDGSGRVKLYLKLEGDSTNFSASYDRASAREAFRQSLRNEGLNLRAILRDEFSFLRPAASPDSVLGKQPTDTLAKPKPKDESTKFEIEWD